MSKKVSNRPAGLGRMVPRQHLDSSITREVKAQSGHMLCKECGAQYHEKHWYTTDSTLETGLPSHMKETLCPGCYRVKNKIFNGIVVLEGENLAEMNDSIKMLLRHVEERCWEDNPASRIFDLIEHDKRIEMKTATEWLATRIGKELKKSFKGTLDIKNSPEKNLVYVNWVAPVITRKKKPNPRPGRYNNGPGSCKTC